MAEFAANPLDRRSFLTGRRAGSARPNLRAPWSDDISIAAHCTGCGTCITACPEGILARDDAGRPVVALAGGACTFCGACAESCPEPVFDRDRDPPWRVSARVTPDCLLTLGIACQLCADACDTDAIVFQASTPPMGAVRVAAATCTGCGACLGTCPVEAIELHRPDGRAVQV